MGIMANSYDSEGLQGFGDGQTDKLMDICDFRVTFATENFFSWGFCDYLQLFQWPDW